MTTFNIDKSRGYVDRKRSGNVHYVCTSHGNPLVSIRAESCEGSSRLPALVAMMEASEDMLAALQDADAEICRLWLEIPDPGMVAAQPFVDAQNAIRAAIAKATGQG